MSLGYSLTRTELFDISSGASSAFLLESGSRTKSQINTAVVFDTRDNPFLSRRGTRVVFSPYVAGGFLGGDTQIYGVDLFYKWKSPHQHAGFPFVTWQTEGMARRFHAGAFAGDAAALPPLAALPAETLTD